MGWSALHTLSDGRYKVIDAPRPELYDLERDPFETDNIYTDRPALGALMTARVRSLARRSDRAQTAPEPPAEFAARLAALGYVGSSGRAGRDGRRRAAGSQGLHRRAGHAAGRGGARIAAGTSGAGPAGLPLNAGAATALGQPRCPKGSSLSTAAAVSKGKMPA